MAGATKVGNLAVVLSGNAAPLSAVLDSSRKDLRRFAGDVSSFGRSGGAGVGVGGLMAGLAGGAGGAAATAGATLAMTAATAAGNLLSGSLSSVAGLTLEAAKTAVRAAADYERMGVAFEVMTGSAKAGQKLLTDIQKLAVATPFGFAELSRAGQTLMGMGVEAGSVIPALSRIGDIAAGDGEKLARLARAFGQVRAAGRFQADELNQFAEAGVGVTEFARAAGMGVAQFRAAMEQGKIGADVVTKALNDMTSAGGTFFGMNAKQSKTAAGQWNSLAESASFSLARIGEAAFKKLDVSGRLGRVADWLGGMEAGAQPFLATLGKAGPLVDDVIGGAKTLAAMAVDFGKAWLGQSPTMESVRKQFKDVMFGAITWVARLGDAALWLQRQFGWMKQLAKWVSPLYGITAALTPEAGSAKGLADGTGMVSKAAAAWIKAMEAGHKAMADTAKEAEKIQIDANKASADMEKAAAAVRAGMADDPLTKFRKEMADLRGAGQFVAGFTRKEMDFGMARAFEQLEKGLGNVKPPELPKAVLRGSQEAEDAIAKAMAAGGSKDWEKRVEDTLKRAEHWQKMTYEQAAATAAALRKLDLKPSNLR